MNLAIVLGTRPELIKLAGVIRECRLRRLNCQIFLTGQHRELLNGLLELFDLGPAIDLQLDPGPHNLATLTADILKKFDQQVLTEKNWDAVLVQGDTATALATGLAAFFRRIPVAHIEAGLRTFDVQQPFPEELNRQVLSRLAHWHFCPTARAKANLFREGTAPADIVLCGNTAIDALEFVLEQKLSPQYARDLLPTEAPELAQALNQIQENQGATLSLMTVHRRENQHSGIISLFQRIREWMGQHPQHHMLYPYHLNPKVKELVIQHLSGLPNLHLLPPLSYRPMIYALTQCQFALSDSAGLQEELPTLKKPLLILRDVTERPEILEKGHAKAIGLQADKVINELDAIWSAMAQRKKPSWYRPKNPNPFGDGHSSVRIVERLVQDLVIKKKITLAS